MNDKSSNLVSEIVATAERLAELARQLQGGAPQPDAAILKMVAEKMSKRICLACNKKCTDPQYRRGLDTKHYNEFLRKSGAGKVSEADLIARGKLAPRGMEPSSVFDQTTLPGPEESATDAAGKINAATSRAAKKQPKGKGES